VDRLLCSICKVSEERFGFFSEIELTEKKVTQFHQFETEKVISRFGILSDISKIGEGGEESMSGSFGEIYFRR
jgi:hypothetical protein